MIFVAETTEGAVVGYVFAWIVCYCNHSTYREFDCFYIDNICVLEAYRRNGIGRKLFERCRAEAKSDNMKCWNLGDLVFNTDAPAFYRRLRNARLHPQE